MPEHCGQVCANFLSDILLKYHAATNVPNGTRGPVHLTYHSAAKNKKGPLISQRPFALIMFALMPTDSDLPEPVRPFGQSPQVKSNSKRANKAVRPWMHSSIPCGQNRR